jgi:hypothetical protein
MAGYVLANIYDTLLRNRMSACFDKRLTVSFLYRNITECDGRTHRSMEREVDAVSSL